MDKKENVKLKIELLKLEYAIIKDKLLLFGAGFGGSFTTLIAKNLPIMVEYGLYLSLAFTFVGILSNLKKAGRMLNEIKELKGMLHAG